MKKITILLAALLGAMLWTGCKDTLETDDPTNPGEKPVAARDSVMLTIEAGKGFDTKALALVENATNATLTASWKEGEKVYVFAPGSATHIGELTAHPKDRDNTKATLSGTISTTGLKVGDVLTLLFPKSTWSYNNQGGTLDSIASNFDFARTQVTISAISTTQMTTDRATTTFENKQSIYRFGFLYSSNTIPSKTVLLTSSQGKLVKNVNMANGEKTFFTSNDPLTVNLSDTPTAGQLIYIAICNDANTNQKDDFSFTIYDDDGATYKGSKEIPPASLVKHFVSAKTISMDRLEVPQGSTNVATAL